MSAPASSLHSQQAAEGIMAINWHWEALMREWLAGWWEAQIWKGLGCLWTICMICLKFQSICMLGQSLKPEDFSGSHKLQRWGFKWSITVFVAWRCILIWWVEVQESIYILVSESHAQDWLNYHWLSRRPGLEMVSQRSSEKGRQGPNFHWLLRKLDLETVAQHLLEEGHQGLNFTWLLQAKLGLRCNRRESIQLVKALQEECQMYMERRAWIPAELAWCHRGLFVKEGQHNFPHGAATLLVDGVSFRVAREGQHVLDPKWS